LGIADLPEYDDSPGCQLETKGKGKEVGNGEEEGATAIVEKGRRRKARERVLIITGSRERWHRGIESDDEDWIRVHGGDYGVLDKLRRIDIR
jgi:hypothetical protein